MTSCFYCNKEGLRGQQTKRKMDRENGGSQGSFGFGFNQGGATEAAYFDTSQNPSRTTPQALEPRSVGVRRRSQKDQARSKVDSRNSKASKKVSSKKDSGRQSNQPERTAKDSSTCTRRPSDDLVAEKMPAGRNSTTNPAPNRSSKWTAHFNEKLPLGRQEGAPRQGSVTKGVKKAEPPQRAPSVKEQSKKKKPTAEARIIEEDNPLLWESARLVTPYCPEAQVAEPSTREISVGHVLPVGKDTSSSYARANNFNNIPPSSTEQEASVLSYSTMLFQDSSDIVAEADRVLITGSPTPAPFSSQLYQKGYSPGFQQRHIESVQSDRQKNMALSPQNHSKRQPNVQRRWLAKKRQSEDEDATSPDDSETNHRHRHNQQPIQKVFQVPQDPATVTPRQRKCCLFALFG